MFWHPQLRKTGIAEAKAVKGSQIALGMALSALSEKQKEKVALIAAKSPELYQAYQHKEELRHILSMKKDPDAAENALNDWIERMEHSEVEEFQDIAEKNRKTSPEHLQRNSVW